MTASIDIHNILDFREHWKSLNLSRLPRRFHCAFPLRHLGFLEDWTHPLETINHKLELSIRLGSNEERLCEMIDSQHFESRYPCAIIKIPGMNHTQEIRSPRDSIFFQYDPTLTDAMRAAGLLEPPLVWECRLTPALITQLRLVERFVNDPDQEGVADRLDLIALQIWQDLLIDRGRGHRTDRGPAAADQLLSAAPLHGEARL